MASISRSLLASAVALAVLTLLVSAPSASATLGFGMRSRNSSKPAESPSGLPLVPTPVPGAPPITPAPGETPPGTFPPPPPSPLVPPLPEVLESGGPAYRIYNDSDNNNENVSIAILWILPPKFGLEPAKTYPDITVKQGTLVELAWAGDPHNVWWTSSSQGCPSRPAVEEVNAIKNLIPTRTAAKLSDYTESQRAVTATKGTFYLVCTVDAHCENGMKLKVNVV